MIDFDPTSDRKHVGIVAALLIAAMALPGCAQMSDGVSTAFADPAKYDLYDCQQLAKERKALEARTAELQALMAKAETGAAGALVAEIAYRNDYIATRGQANLAEEAWRRNRCQDAPPPAPTRPVRPTISTKRTG